MNTIISGSVIEASGIFSGFVEGITSEENWDV